MEIYKKKPFAHQLKALELSKEKKNFAYFMEMGTGKSKVTIDDVSRLYREGEVTGLLLVAPKGIYKIWLREQLPQHMPDDIEYNAVLWEAHKVNSENYKAKVRGLADTSKLQVFIVNVESLSSPSGKCTKACKWFLKKHQGKTVMVVDESTTIKNHSAARTKNCMAVGINAEYKRILSGQPMPNGPLDLWAQVAFMDWRLTGKRSWYAFRGTYATLVDMDVGPRVIKKVAGYKNLEQLNDILNSFSYIVKKKDCLDLPDKLPAVHREVEMTKEQTRAYNQLVQESLYSIDDDVIVTAEIVLSLMIRLHQVVCGFVGNIDGDIHPLKNNRIAELMSVAEEIISPTEGKLIVWATYVYNIEEIAKELKKKYGDDAVVTYYGKTSDSERTYAVEAFQDPDSPVRVFVGNPQTAGFGLTLTAAHHVVYYSNNHNLEHRQQSEDRAHRIGQTKNVTYINLVSTGTVDETILKALETKTKLVDAVVQAKDKRKAMEDMVLGVVGDAMKVFDAEDSGGTGFRRTL